MGHSVFFFLCLCRASEAAKAAIESPLLDFPVTDAKVNKIINTYIGEMERHVLVWGYGMQSLFGSMVSF